MSQLQEIYEGWKRLAFPTPEIEIEAKRRIAICVQNDCKKFRSNKTCALCGCFMPAKCRSLKSHCMIGKW
jgi:hypothetical protein